MKVLVTGASGFIGRSLVAYLLARGSDVVPVVRRASGIPNERVLDLEDRDAWRIALDGCDSVVHLAGRAHVMHETAADPAQAFTTGNVDNTLTVARYAAAAGVPRFVFLSSIKVNGERTQPGQCFHADDKPDPQDEYARSKLAAEEALFELSAQTGLEVVVIRPPLVYGPGVKGNFAQLIRWGTGRMPLPLGAIDNARSMIALDNLLQFVHLCADRAASPKAAKQIFLVADGPAASTTQLLKKVATAYGRGPWLVPVPGTLLRWMARLLGKSGTADKLLGSLVVSDQKARALLGWKPATDPNEQLRRMHDGAG
jgi:nucleoside-diphosphate-sugar epimerase